MDLEEFKSEVNAIVLKVQAAPDNTKTYANVLTNIFLSCFDGGVPSRDILQLYVHWNRVCPERRGTEKLCVINFHKAVNSLASESNDTVLTIQKKLISEGIPFEKRIAPIRSFYEKETQPDRVFARIQGIVDSMADKEPLVKPQRDVARKGSTSVSCFTSQEDSRNLPSMLTYSPPDDCQPSTNDLTDELSNSIAMHISVECRCKNLFRTLPSFR